VDEGKAVPSREIFVRSSCSGEDASADATHSLKAYFFWHGTGRSDGWQVQGRSSDASAEEASRKSWAAFRV
jgi:hypothetical protein